MKYDFKNFVEIYLKTKNAQEKWKLMIYAIKI